MIPFENRFYSAAHIKYNVYIYIYWYEGKVFTISRKQLEVNSVVLIKLISKRLLN